MKRNRHISQSELESYLWGDAVQLRGHIDAGDYKQFIFPLLFYKRLCDVYDEELAEALEESGGDQSMDSLFEALEQQTDHFRGGTKMDQDQFPDAGKLIGASGGKGPRS